MTKAKTPNQTDVLLDELLEGCQSPEDIFDKHGLVKQLTKRLVERALRTELATRNQSAARSLAEGLKETLTLHRLGVVALLSLSFKATNCLESINALVEKRCTKVDRWTNSH